MSLMSQLIDEASTDPALQALTREEGEAVIDLLTAIVHADDKVAFLEKSELEHLLLELPWAEGKHEDIDRYIEQAVERAKGPERAKAFGELARRAAELIEPPKARQRIYQMAAALANADFEIHETEALALGKLAEAFGLDEATITALQAAAGWG